MNGDPSSSTGKAVRRWPHLKALREARDIDALLDELNNQEQTAFETNGETFHFTVRGEAARQLGHLQDPRAVMPIADLLQDPRFMVRSEAAMALGAIGDRSAVPLLIDALNDKHASVRLRAAEGLGRLSDNTASSKLIDTLNDPNPKVRLAVARALAHIGDRQAIHPLQEAARREGFGHPYRRLRFCLALISLRRRFV